MGDLYGRVVSILNGNPVLTFVADMCITVSVVILFLLLVRPLMKRLPRMGMYVLWFAVLVRMMCPVTVRGIYHIVPESFEQKMSHVINSRQIECEALKEQNEQEVHNAGRGNRGTSPQKTAVYQGSDAAQGDMQTVSELPRVTNDEQPEVVWQEEKSSLKAVNADGREDHGMQWGIADLLVVLWGAGVLCCAGIMIVSLMRMWWRYRDAALCFENVYTHPLVEGPFVGGIILPKIYLPEQMAEKDRRYILCHERVHVRRRDYLVKPIAFLAFSLLWFNPLVWVAYHLMLRDMEISCDEMAVRDFTAEEKKEYSYLLLGMTGGRKRYLSQNLAFSAGVVKERIVSVMKSKKPTKIMTAMAVAAVVLCSCGIASEPENTVEETPVNREEEQNEERPEDAYYVEQSFSLPDGSEEFVKGYSTAGASVLVDSDGNIVQFAELWKQPDDSSYRYAKLQLEDGKWVLQEAAWLEEQINQKIKEKNYIIDEYWYGENGQLYMQVSEMSMNMAKYRKMRDRWEKEKDVFYLKKTHLFQINEETNETVEINVPQKSVKEAVDEGKVEESGLQTENGVMLCDIHMFSDGNLLIQSYDTNEIGVYSGTTGELLTDLRGVERISSSVTGICTGNGFLAFGVVNQQSEKLEIVVVGEDGKLLNTIPTEFEYKQYIDEEEESMADFFGMRVCGDEIILVADHCIYEAGPDSDAFTNVVNEEKDHLFYLPQYGVLSVAGKDAEGKYTLVLTPVEGGSMKVCCYEKAELK